MIKSDTGLKDANEVKDEPSSQLFAWCSNLDNRISIVDLETKQEYVQFDGAPLRYNTSDKSWTHLKEIPNTKLLVSLNQCYFTSANMEIFDISQKGKPKKIYSFEEIIGRYGDVTFNSRRNILGAISLGDRIAYHLFSIEYNRHFSNAAVKLLRKAKWHSQYSMLTDYETIVSLDFDPHGEFMATLQADGVCLISDVTANNCKFYSCIGEKDPWGRCRWSTNPGEALLFVKHNKKELNILDLEKQTQTLKNPIVLEKGETTFWIDICPNNGNLLAACGFDYNIKIFDKRESKVAKVFDDVHSNYIGCVRWHPSGEILASSSKDKTAQIIDFKTGKVIYTGITADGNDLYSVCFI